MSNTQRHVAFDQIKYVHRLEAVGVSREQAEIQAQTFSDFINNHLATKQDVLNVEVNLRQEIDFKIESLKRDLKIWFGGMFTTFIVVMSGIMAMIVHLK